MACFVPLILFSATVQPPQRFEMPFDAINVSLAATWQTRLRARLLDIVSAHNARTEKPLDIQLGPFVDKTDYRQMDLSFMGNEDKRIDATLTVPSGDGPFPAVVCLHGHGGSREKVHDASTEYNGFATAFARRGFVTLAPSLWHCDYAPNQLWNLMRLVDVLETQKWVDKERIAVAGLSMGGEWSMWLAACDTRIKAAIVSGWMCTTEGVLRVPNCPCWMPPGLLGLCDIAEVHILIAPRPLLIESATEDPCFPIDATRKGFDMIRRGYAVFGAEDKVKHHTFPGGHAWNGGQAYAFIEKALEVSPRNTGSTSR